MNAAEDKLGELIDGKYELEELLGRGGMGAVYRARHTVTGRSVAIKWLLEDDPNRRERFLREARAMGRLSHPNVVQVLDVGEHDERAFLIMDYLEGHPLRAFVREGGIPAAEAIGLLMPALAGVEAAHRADVLHRDLKPENLFVLCDRDGTPYDTKVLDFGLAKVTQDDAQDKLTRSGSILGTPRYMSPEQLEEQDLDARCDVFALGMILYELLAGELPYRARSLNALLLEILTISIEAPPNIDPELGEILVRAVARNPVDRPASVAELASLLEPFADPDVVFEAPREVHTSSASNTGPHRAVTGEVLTPSVVGHLDTRPGTPRAKVDREGETVEEDSTEAAVAALPSRPSPLIWAAVIGLAVIVGVGGMLAFGPNDEPEVTEEETAETESTAVSPAATTAVTVPQAPETTPDPAPEPEPDPVVEPTPEPAPELTAEAEPTPPAPHPTTRRRRRRRPTPASNTETPTTTPTEAELRVRGRSGTFAEEEF